MRLIIAVAPFKGVPPHQPAAPVSLQDSEAGILPTMTGEAVEQRTLLRRQELWGGLSEASAAGPEAGLSEADVQAQLDRLWVCATVPEIFLLDSRQQTLCQIGHSTPGLSQPGAPHTTRPRHVQCIETMLTF